MKRTLPIDALNCLKRTVITQLKSVVFFTFTLFGRIIWETEEIQTLLGNRQTNGKGVIKTLNLQKENPLSKLIVGSKIFQSITEFLWIQFLQLMKKLVILQEHYKSSSKNWPEKGEEAFTALSAASDKGDVDEMSKACKIIIDAP